MFKTKRIKHKTKALNNTAKQKTKLNGDNMLQKDEYLIANIPDYTFGLIYRLQYVNIYMVSYLCSTAATIKPCDASSQHTVVLHVRFPPIP